MQQHLSLLVSTDTTSASALISGRILVNQPLGCTRQAGNMDGPRQPARTGWMGSAAECGTRCANPTATCCHCLHQIQHTRSLLCTLPTQTALASELAVLLTGLQRRSAR